MMEGTAIEGEQAAQRPCRIERLLLFNLATDDQDPLLAFTVDWIRALADRVPYVDVVTMRSGTADLPGNVRVYSVGKERGWTEARRVAEFYRRLGLLLHEQSYDACFAHMQELFALLAAPLLRPKRVPITLWYCHPHTPLQLRAAIKVVDRVISADASSCRVPTPKLLVTGHGIDTNRFVPDFRQQSRFTVLVVGAITPLKRLDLLVEAVARIHDRLPKEFEVRFIGPTQAGDSAYENDLRRRAAELGVASRITFVGSLGTEALVAEYQAADALVSLTVAGSFDKSALEGMSCGLPLLTMNPAFGPMMTAAYAPGLLPSGDVGAVARGIELLANATVEERRQWGVDLRAEVVQSHSLQRLADLLVDEIL